MGKLGPVSWEDLVRKLRKQSFEGPYWGGKHPYMVKGDLVLTIPNPHRREISVNLLSLILSRPGYQKESGLKDNRVWIMERTVADRRVGSTHHVVKVLTG